jgi:hypothetical protein
LVVADGVVDHGGRRATNGTMLSALADNEDRIRSLAGIDVAPIF